jgi:hypothetical protein
MTSDTTAQVFFIWYGKSLIIFTINVTNQFSSKRKKGMEHHLKKLHKLENVVWCIQKAKLLTKLNLIFVH